MAKMAKEMLEKALENAEASMRYFDYYNNENNEEIKSGYWASCMERDGKAAAYLDCYEMLTGRKVVNVQMAIKEEIIVNTTREGKAMKVFEHNFSLNDLQDISFKILFDNLNGYTVYVETITRIFMHSNKTAAQVIEHYKEWCKLWDVNERDIESIIK